MDSLEQIVCEEVEKYAAQGRGIDLRLYFLQDATNRIYAVNAIVDPFIEDMDEDRAGVVVIARVEGETVIIEDDATDKPLIDALLQRGVPRSQIVLAYAGEALPTPIGK